MNTLVLFYFILFHFLDYINNTITFSYDIMVIFNSTSPLANFFN